MVSSNAHYVLGTVLSVLCKFAHLRLTIPTVTTLVQEDKHHGHGSNPPKGSRAYCGGFRICIQAVWCPKSKQTPVL